MYACEFQQQTSRLSTSDRSTLTVIIVVKRFKGCDGGWFFFRRRASARQTNTLRRLQKSREEQVDGGGFPLLDNHSN